MFPFAILDSNGFTVVIARSPKLSLFVAVSANAAVGGLLNFVSTLFGMVDPLSGCMVL